MEHIVHGCTDEQTRPPSTGLTVLLRCLLLMLAGSILIGCSATRIAYQNADWLVVETIDDYIDLNRAQTQALDAALDQHLDWHCQTQLPAYVGWLERVKATLAEPSIDRRNVAARIEELSGFVDALAVEITPTTSALLRDLTDPQLQDLSRNLAEKHAEMREKYGAPPLDQQIEQRAERLEERLDRWLGRLTQEQRERILEWSTARADQNQFWLENRRHWQLAFLQVLKRRSSPDFERQVADLLQNPERYRSSDWAKRSAVSWEAAVDLTTDLLRLTTPQQQRHLQQAVEDLQQDFESLICSV